MRSILAASGALALILGLSAGVAAQDRTIYVVTPNGSGSYDLIPAEEAAAAGYVVLPQGTGYVLVPSDECDLTDPAALCSQSTRSNADLSQGERESQPNLGPSTGNQGDGGDMADAIDRGLEQEPGLNQ